ncbi:MAG: hypothetical protein O3A74_04335 [archaeon]|nr:hypothetical protein [archaeon]
MSDMTFLGKIERVSHEDGLLASFSGPSPALNSVLMLASDQSYVGKVDGVLGSIDQPLIHIAHLDNKVDPNTLLEQEILIRPKKERVQEERSSREDRSSFQRDRRDSGRDNRRDGGRDNRRNDRGDRRQFDRRDDRTTSKQSFANNDWTCSKCSNSNFAFREKCNKCDAPREGNTASEDGGRDNRRGDRGNDRQFDRRDGGRDNRRGDRGNDRQFDRRDGGRDNRRDDRGNDRQFDRRDGGRDNRRNDRSTSKENFAHNDWTCSKCSNSNFSFREKCNKCDAPREGSSGTRNAGHRSESRNQRPNQGGQQKPPQQYRKSRGKGPNHAHNRPPKEIGHRRPKNDDF